MKVVVLYCLETQKVYTFNADAVYFIILKVPRSNPGLEHAKHTNLINYFSQRFLNIYLIK